MPPAYSNDLKSWRIVYLQHDGYSGEQKSKLLYVSHKFGNKFNQSEVLEKAKIWEI